MSRLTDLSDLTSGTVPVPRSSAPLVGRTLIVCSDEPDATQAGRALADALRDAGLQATVAPARHAHARARAAKDRAQLDALIAIGDPFPAALVAMATGTPLAIHPSAEQVLAAIAAGLPVARCPILRVRPDRRPPVSDFGQCTLTASPGTALEVTLPGRRAVSSPVLRAATCDPLHICGPTPMLDLSARHDLRLYWTESQPVADVLLPAAAVVQVSAAPGSHIELVHDAGRVRGIASAVTIGPNPILHLIRVEGPQAPFG